MKRVKPSRQRLVSPNVIDAITPSSDRDFLMGPSLGNSMDVMHPANLLNPDQLDLGICRKRSLELRASKSKPPALPALVPASYKAIVKDNKTGNRDVKAGFHELNDDVKLHIMSFLEASEGRAVSSTCHILRRLLLSKDAEHLWNEWCHYQWPMLRVGQAPIVFRDDFSLPTALGNLNNSLEANLSLLLGMASRSHPTRVDESKFSPDRLQPGIHNWGQPRLPERYTPPQFRSFTQDNMICVQFIGAVGDGERCFVADKPLPRPKRISSTTRKLTSEKGKPSFRDVFCPAKSSSNSGWRPFVAPFMTPPTTTSDDGLPLEVHLTPRLVSYFEATILQRDESQEPFFPIPQRNSATDCVAVGVSCNGFRLTSRMPGWDSLSYGYHGDDGCKFHGGGDVQKQFGPRYGPGDTVGCGVDYVSGGIFFTLNGKFLGYGWTGIDAEFLEHCNLYPTIGVDTNCPISCNFGERPFCYNLTPLVKYHGCIVEGCFTSKEISARKSSLSNSFRRPRIFASPLKMK